MKVREIFLKKILRMSFPHDSKDKNSVGKEGKKRIGEDARKLNASGFLRRGPYTAVFHEKE